MARRTFCPSLLISLPPSDRLVKPLHPAQKARADGEGSPLSGSTTPGRPSPSHRISRAISSSFLRAPHQAEALTISRDLGPGCSRMHPVTHLGAEEPASVPPPAPQATSPSLTTCLLILGSCFHGILPLEIKKINISSVLVGSSTDDEDQ